MSKEKLQKCLDEIGIAFLFAQDLHPAMKYVASARKEIGKKTMFNLLGPLSNPAGATHQLVGVYDVRWTAILAEVLMNLGSVHALVVCGEDGLDELTTTAKTKVARAYKEKIFNYQIGPEDFGIKKAKLEDLLGGNASSNAKIFLDILHGEPGPKRDIVILNAAAAIFAAEKAKTIDEGIELAEESIDSQKALEKFELFKQYSLN